MKRYFSEEEAGPAPRDGRRNRPCTVWRGILGEIRPTVSPAAPGKSISTRYVSTETYICGTNEVTLEGCHSLQRFVGLASYDTGGDVNPAVSWIGSKRHLQPTLFLTLDSVHLLENIAKLRKDSTIYPFLQHSTTCGSTEELGRERSFGLKIETIPSGATGSAYRLVEDAFSLRASRTPCISIEALSEQQGLQDGGMRNSTAS